MVTSYGLAFAAISAVVVMHSEPLMRGLLELAGDSVADLYPERYTMEAALEAACCFA